MQSWRSKLLLVAITAFVTGIMFSGASLLVQDLGSGTTNSAHVAGANAEAVPGVGQDEIANIVDDVGASVVKISTTVTVNNTHQFNPLYSDPFKSEPGQRQESGLGSGFIISKDGYIVTNEHVIDGAEEITVTVEGYTEPFKAEVVGADYDLDLAVLKINANKALPVLTLGDSDKIKVGNWVIAIGNPYGLDHTVTTGVISAKERPVNIGQRSYKNLLQTDTSINPGNSGGPLLNLAGEVVGINTAVNVEAQGIGFAIPTSTVKSVLDELIEKGKVVRPWLGVQLQPLDQEIAKYVGLKSTAGVLVVGVVPGSPAEGAGLQRGDVILEIDNTKINNVDDLSSIVQKAKVGQKLVLLVHRESSDFNVTLSLNEKPAKY